MLTQLRQRFKVWARACLSRQSLLVFAVISFAHALLPRCAAQTATQHEYELKAAVLYHVIKYVEWPAGFSTNTTLQIGLVGEMPFADAIEVLNGKKIQGRELIVKRVTTPQEAGQCQVLFISASERLRLREIVGEVKGRPILTVSEVEGFAEGIGGMVNLVAGQNRIVMEINRQAAGEAGLGISSQLLKLAKVYPR